MGTGNSGPALGTRVDGGCSGGGGDIDDEENEASAKGRGEHYADKGTQSSSRLELSVVRYRVSEVDSEPL